MYMESTHAVRHLLVIKLSCGYPVTIGDGSYLWPSGESVNTCYDILVDIITAGQRPYDEEVDPLEPGLALRKRLQLGSGLTAEL